jgi:hypothetical protein
MWNKHTSEISSFICIQLGLMKFATFILKIKLIDFSDWYETFPIIFFEWCIYFCFREFLGQAWMKTDKATKAPHIILMTKRFNEVSIIICHHIHHCKIL